jgi:hypothetical protein
MQWARTQEVLKILHSQIPPKQLMLLGEKRGRTKRNTKSFQDLDQKASPHLEERLIGGMIDLDLLSLFPLIGGKNHGGIERNPSSRRSTMGVKFVLSKAGWLEVGGGVFIPLPEKEPLQPT